MSTTGAVSPRNILITQVNNDPSLTGTKHRMNSHNNSETEAMDTIVMIERIINPNREPCSEGRDNSG